MKHKPPQYKEHCINEDTVKGKILRTANRMKYDHIKCMQTISNKVKIHIN